MTAPGLRNAASAGFERFRARVHADPSLQARLAGVRDTGAFVALVIATAAELGLDLSAADVEDAMRAGQIAWLTAACDIL